MHAALAVLWLLPAGASGGGLPAVPVVERVTTIAPFPRGLAMVDGKLLALCRGRVRGSGGVSAAVEDQAGTLYMVDPDVTQPLVEAEASEAVRTNGRVLAVPTDPPFKLWNRAADPPSSDRETDRPYCALRWHEASRNLFICAFSGIDKARKPGESLFSKNLTDALLRYDLRTKRWHEVERHDIEAGGNYPHHDPRHAPPPHGWLNGPNNCLVVGDSLYAVAKDNSLLVRYDLASLVHNPDAGPSSSHFVFDGNVYVQGRGMMRLQGHSALATHDDRLYIGFRTTSEIVRIRLDAHGLPVQPIIAELVAQFQPYDPATRESANITDMDFDSKGRLYVISAEPARVFRFTPDPGNVFDAVDPGTPAWLDLAALTGNPRMKSENILVDDRDRLFITSGDGYGYQAGADGTVYRVTPVD
jgi:hypothetical protein